MEFDKGKFDEAIKIKKLTSSERAKIFRSFIKFGRSYPSFLGFIKSSMSFSDMFECVNIFSEKIDFSDEKKVKDWVKIALSDLSAAIKLYKTEDGLALYHLQQGIEKLFKATLIYSGFKKESDVIRLNHKPQQFIIELLEDTNVQKMLNQNFPYKHIRKPKKIEKNKLEKLKKSIDSNNKEKSLEEGDALVKVVINLLGKPIPLLYDPNHIGDKALKEIEKIIPKKELKRFKNQISVKNMSFEDIIYIVSNDYFILVNMTTILLPLSAGIWAFESVPRYPDELRKIKKDFKEYEAHKAFYTIINHCENFGEFFRLYLD